MLLSNIKAFPSYRSIGRLKKKFSGFALEPYRDFLRTLSNVVLTGCNTYVINDIALGLTPGKSIHNNVHSSIPPWFIADFLVARAIKIAKKIPILKILPADLVNSLLISVIYPALKIMVKDKNSIAQLYDKKNKSQEELIISQALKKKPMAKVMESLSGFHKKYFAKTFDFFFKYCLGVATDKNGKPKVNMLHYCLSNVAILLASVFSLDRHEKSIGFEDANSKSSALRSFFVHSLTRLNYGLFTSLPIHLKGFNYHQVFNNILSRKMTNTVAQALIDACVSPLKKSPVNPATLATILKMFFEFLVPMYNRALMKNINNKIQVPKDVDFIAHKLLKPCIMFFEEKMSPIFEWLAKNIYSRYLGGIYDPKILHMYNKKLLHRDLKPGLPQYLNKYKDIGFLKTIYICFKTVIKTPIYFYQIFQNPNQLGTKKKLAC